MMYDGWMWGHGWGGGSWILMWVVMMLFWACVITAIALAFGYLIRSGSVSGGSAHNEPRRPDDVLGGRLARGERDADEGGGSRCCTKTPDHDD